MIRSEWIRVARVTSSSRVLPGYDLDPFDGPLVVPGARDADQLRTGGERVDLESPFVVDSKLSGGPGNSQDSVGHRLTIACFDLTADSTRFLRFLCHEARSEQQTAKPAS